MAGLVGLLRQLGDLAEFAAEIFRDLHEEVMVTASRGNALKLRVHQLEAELPSIEKALLIQIGHPTFSYKTGTCWHANLHIDQSLVTQGDMPRFILDSYEECHAPPKLFMLDMFDVAGAGACLKRYSDPSFFKNTLDASGAVEYMERDTKFRKVKKKGQHWRNSETLESLLSPRAGRSSQADRTDQVPEKVPTWHVKLKPRHLAVHDIRRNYIENLFRDPLPEEKLMLENSEHGSLNSIVEVPKIQETGVTALINDPLFRKKTPSQSPDQNEEEVPTAEELEKLHAHGEEFLYTLHDSKLEEPNSYSSHPIVHFEDKPAKLETSKVNIVDKLISCELEGRLSLFKEVDRVEMLSSDDAKSGDLHGSHSDIVSETESYTDALNTMESEVETDNDSRARLGLGFSGAEYQAIESDTNENQALQVQLEEADSIGDYAASSVIMKKDIDTSNSEASGKFSGSMTIEESFGVASYILPNPDYSQETIDGVTGDLKQEKYIEQKGLEACSTESVDDRACQGLQDNGEDMALRSADHRSYDGISDNKACSDQYIMREQHANIFSDVELHSLSDPFVQENRDGIQADDDKEVSSRSLNGNYAVDSDEDVNPLHNTDISGLPCLVEMDTYSLAVAAQEVHDNAEEMTSVDAKVIQEASVQTQYSNEIGVTKQHFEELLSSSSPEREQEDIKVSSAIHRASIDSETNNDLSNWRPDSLINDTENGNDVGGLATYGSLSGFKDTGNFAEDEMSPKTSSLNWEHYLDADVQESGREELADYIEEESLPSHAHSDQHVLVVDKMISAFGSTVSGPYDEGTNRQSMLLVNEKVVAGIDTDELKAHSLYAAVGECCLAFLSQPDLISHQPDENKNNPDVDKKTLSSISVSDDGPSSHVHSEECSVLQDEGLEQHNMEDAKSYCQECTQELEKQHLVDTAVPPEGNQLIFVSKASSFETSIQDSYDELSSRHLHSLASDPAHEDANSYNDQENEIHQLHSEQNMPTRDALECASDGNQEYVTSSPTGIHNEINVSNVYALESCDGSEMNSNFLKEDAKVDDHLASVMYDLYLAQDDMTSIKFFTAPVVEEATETQTSRFSAELTPNDASNEYNLAEFGLDSLQSDAKDDEQLASTKQVHSSVDLISSSISLCKDHVISGYEASETRAVEMGLHALKEDMHDGHLGDSDHHFETVNRTGDTVAIHNIDLPFEASDPEAQRLLSNEELEKRQHNQLNLQVLSPPQISSSELDLARLETSFQASQVQSSETVFSYPRLDDTPTLPPLPPLEWRIGKFCLGSLSSYDTIQTSAESSTFMVSSFLQKDHSHGLLTLGNGNEKENEKSAKTPIPNMEGDLLQDASRVKVVKPLRLAELPPIAADRGNPDGVVLPEEVGSPQGTVAVEEGMDIHTHSELEQNSFLAPSLPSQEENGHQLPLHGEDKQSTNSLDLSLKTDTNTPFTKVQQKLESIESETNGLSGLNLGSDYPQHLNPYLAVSIAEQSQSEHDYGVDNIQLINPLAPLPATGSLVLPSDSTPSLGHNPFTSYGVIDPVMEDEKPYRRRSSILNRPRDPLIQAVASHDKSTLRKVSGMVQYKPKEGERDTLLEQIRNKSFNLKPASVTRPSIKGPQTNLKVAAILEKANAIRQACVGSDDDEDGDWSDS